MVIERNGFIIVLYYDLLLGYFDYREIGKGISYLVIV